MMISVVFALELALLFVHEMDAVRKQEWKMFAVLKNMDAEKGYRVFTLLHIPLYAAILFLLFSSYSNIGYYIIDIFLIVHLLIHFLFRKHSENKLNGAFSKAIIWLAGLLAALHCIGILFGWTAPSLVKDALQRLADAGNIQITAHIETQISTPINALDMDETFQIVGDQKSRISQMITSGSMIFTPEGEMTASNENLSTTMYRYVENGEQISVRFDQDGNFNTRTVNPPSDLPYTFGDGYFDRMEFLEDEGDFAVYQGIKNHDFVYDSTGADIESEQYIYNLVALQGFIPATYRIYVDRTDGRIVKIAGTSTFAFEEGGDTYSIDGRTEIGYRYEDVAVVLPENIDQYDNEIAP